MFIRLGDELELLRKYMIIQNYRYDNQIELRIDCPEDMEDLHVPRMLLQPIVENAIFHGIARLMKGRHSDPDNTAGAGCHGADRGQRNRH